MNGRHSHFGTSISLNHISGSSFAYEPDALIPFLNLHTVLLEFQYPNMVFKCISVTYKHQFHL
jgi:hypothetical protein